MARGIAKVPATAAPVASARRREMVRVFETMVPLLPGLARFSGGMPSRVNKARQFCIFIITIGQMGDGAEYDYIVAGAGSAGCVLARRLSDDPGVSVLLLEAGGRDSNPLLRVPMMTGLLLR